jgi:DNA-directed RNA polymerase specialized sigma24 family protein
MRQATQEPLQQSARRSGVWQSEWMPPAASRSAEHEREQRLLAQARAGFDWALAAFETRYQPLVARYLAQLTGNPERSRALAEEVFVRMERRLYGPEGLAHARVWLLRATTDTGLAYLRDWRAARPVQMPAGRAPTGQLEPRPATAPTLTRRDALARLGRQAHSESGASTPRPMLPTLPRAMTSALPSALTGAASQTASEHGHNTARPQGRPESQANGGRQPIGADEARAVQYATDPRETLRHRLVRAVLAELPEDDARCLALHLVAGLNQSDVAYTMGLAPAVAREHIIRGVQIFAVRYDDALDALGMPAGALDTATAAERTVRIESPDQEYVGPRTLQRRPPQLGTAPSAPHPASQPIPGLPRRVSGHMGDIVGDGARAVPVTTQRTTQLDGATHSPTEHAAAAGVPAPDAAAISTMSMMPPPRPLAITAPRHAGHPAHADHTDHHGEPRPRQTTGGVAHVPVISGDPPRVVAPAVPSVPVRSPAASRR